MNKLIILLICPTMIFFTFIFYYGNQKIIEDQKIIDKEDCKHLMFDINNHRGWDNDNLQDYRQTVYGQRCL